MLQLQRTIAPRTTQPRYWPIGDYGVIGDCRTAALIAPDGAIDWCCLPHFDSPAVFCRLLDAERGGMLQLRPTEAATATMTYLEGTNILQTSFEQPQGKLNLIDFMPVRPRHKGWSWRSEFHTFLEGFTPPFLRHQIEREVGNDVAAAHRITRLAQAVSGSVTLDLQLRPTFDYARRATQVFSPRHTDAALDVIMTDGEQFLVFVVRYLFTPSPKQHIAWNIADDGTLQAQLLLAHDQRLVVMLNTARTLREAESLRQQLLTHDADADLAETTTFWRAWSSRIPYRGAYREQVIRSALALKLCTFEPTGAIIAAPTTSLPEQVGGARNWDYRFTWLRDTAFTLRALQYLDFYSEARDYFHFLYDLHPRRGDDVQVLYSITGTSGKDLKETVLPHLSGYQGSRPVHIGNAAATQHQLDIYGEFLDAAYRYFLGSGYRSNVRRGEGMRRLQGLVEMLADYVTLHWQDPDDRGIWEVRGQTKSFVYSRVMCWVALDRACKMASPRQRKKVAHWGSVRDQIHAEVMAHGYSERLQSFTQAYDEDVLDAANLRISIVGFLPPDDPHVMKTIAAIEHNLTQHDGLVYRYLSADTPTAVDPQDHVNQTDDGLTGAEGAFGLCTFWLIEALCLAGKTEEARQRFKQMLTYSGPLGLFAEEIDPTTGQQLGNYPQAFTHIGFIMAALALEQAANTQS